MDNEQVTVVDLTKLVERKLMNSEEEGPCTPRNACSVLYMKIKGLFSESIWSLSKHLDLQLLQHVHFVVDGGSLLHRLAWRKSLTDD